MGLSLGRMAERQAQSDMHPALHFHMPAGCLEQALAKAVDCQSAVVWGQYARLYMT